MTSIMYSIFSYFRTKKQQQKIHEHLIEFLHLTCLQTCGVNGANASDVTEEIAAQVIFSSSQICLIAPPCVYCLQPYPAVANLECSCSSCTLCGTKLSYAGPGRRTLSASICVFTSCGGRIWEMLIGNALQAAGALKPNSVTKRSSGRGLSLQTSQ